MPHLVEMMDQVSRYLSFCADAYIVPRQSGLIPHDRGELGVPDLELVVASDVVVFDAWVFGIASEELVLPVVVSSVTHVETSEEGLLLIDYDYLAVV